MKLTLPYPPSVNKYWIRGSKFGHGGVRIPNMRVSDKGKAYRHEAWVAVKQAKLNGIPLEGSLKIVVEVYPPDKRIRDLDNLTKCLFDSLQYARVYKDDYQLDDIHIIRREVVKGGRVEVEVDTCV